ncbi:MAG: septation protein SepH [Actinomycetaceae bacterium]|nr:septation protein SepH [Actinomycetaceae bacterium]
MRSLTLLGPDGDQIVLVDENGERFTLPIDNELRAAVRRDRNVVDSILAATGSDLRPKDLQTLVRAGARAEEVAAQSGLPIEHVRRFEGPVLAERAWVAAQARDCRVDRDSDAPTLGDLAVDRLAARGVDPSTLQWDAVRSPEGPWEVRLVYVQAATEYVASWTLELSDRSVYAINDEARALTESTTPMSPTLATLPSPVSKPAPQALAPTTNTPDVPDSPVRAPQPQETEAILDELAAARGTRLTVATGEEDDDVSAMEAAFGSQSLNQDLDTDAQQAPASVTDFPSTPPSTEADATPAPATVDALATKAEPPTVLPGLEGLEDTPSKAAPRRRSRRKSVPSWDEIVFGTRPDGS